MAGWLDSERPAERGGRWWKDGLVDPVCSLYCVQAQWQTALYGGPQCCLLCQSLWIWVTFSPHNNLCLHQSNIALTTPPCPLIACSHFPSFYLFLAIFHSICPSHLHTELSWEFILHPSPSSKCHYIKVKLKLFLMLYSESWWNLFFQLWHRPGDRHKTNWTGPPVSEAKISECVFAMCVFLRETQRDTEQGGRAGMLKHYGEKGQTGNDLPEREGASLKGCISLHHSHTELWCLPTDMHEGEWEGYSRGAFEAFKRIRSYNSHPLARLWKPLHHSLASRGKFACVCVCINMGVCMSKCLFFPWSRQTSLHRH